MYAYEYGGAICDKLLVRHHLKLLCIFPPCFHFVAGHQGLGASERISAIRVVLADSRTVSVGVRGAQV